MTESHQATSPDEDRFPAGNLQQPTIGIVAALHLEVAPLQEKLPSKRTQRGNGLIFRDCAHPQGRVVIVEGGTGANRATQATHALIDAFQPQWILSVGFSGALVEHLKLGDVVVGDSLVYHNGQRAMTQKFHMSVDPGQGLHVGKLCMSDGIVRTRAEKRELHERTQAIAVDMESLAVAEACRERSTGFMAIRAISDDLSEDLPREVLAIFGPKGTIRAGALVGTLFKRPSSVKDLWKIREQAAHAAERLAQFTHSALPQLFSQPR